MSSVEPMRSNSAHELRFGIDCLHVDTRRALLEAIGTETIIAGAYTDAEQGALCPSVAVHRRGAQGNLAGFAKAWDSFTGAVPGRPRVATAHEMRVLREMLETSLTEDDARRERLRRALGPVPPKARAGGPVARVPEVEPGIERPLGAEDHEDTEGAELDGLNAGGAPRRVRASR